MLAYSRGSNRLAGAAPLEHRVPANVGSFRANLDIAQWVEHRSDKPTVVGSNPAFQLLCKQLTTSDPGWAPANSTR